jgi:hypothetical protein
MSEACIGVDWGTHSSKWCYQDLERRTLVGDLWDSQVWRVEGHLAMFPILRHYRGECGESGLKRKLIDDPDQPFWDGARPKLGASLGEAIVFSLLCLLCDAHAALSERGLGVKDRGPVSVRFSHPNWVTADSVAALQSYRDAVVVALSAFQEEVEAGPSADSFQLPIDQLRDVVARHRPCAQDLEPLPLMYDHAAYARCLKGRAGSVEWELVFESCAAGFPYLVESEPDVFSPDDFADAQYERWRKILVVDIGAGSTDAGYMLRTVRLDSRTEEPESPLLIWLPAAPGFGMAGNWLTDKIRDDWISAGRPSTTRVEAEDYKISGVTDWYAKPYVEEWCRSIAARVAEYMRRVPDNARLPRKPALELVITGGSSAVQPVKPSLIQAVVQALKDRGIQPLLSEATSPLGTSIPSLGSAGYSDIQCAQLAVCFGASHPWMADLKHYPQGL